MPFFLSFSLFGNLAKLWVRVMSNIFGEFDSGSERTLAAWIRHASRTIPIYRDSGKRVSNTWVIYLRARDNIPKGVLIPNETTTSHGVEVKGRDRKACHLRMSPRPISLLAG